jgi:hypothetical protein
MIIDMLLFLVFRNYRYVTRLSLECTKFFNEFNLYQEFNLITRDAGLWHSHL